MSYRQGFDVSIVWNCYDIKAFYDSTVLAESASQAFSAIVVEPTRIANITPDNVVLVDGTSFAISVDGRNTAIDRCAVNGVSEDFAVEHILQ